MDKARIPLEVLRVEVPCPADWDAMSGGDAKRFCTGCQKFVHNLSAMPRAEAERLVCESAGELCVRFARAADGTVVTVDYRQPPAGTRRGWRFWTGVGLIGGIVALVGQVMRGATRGPVAGGAVTAMPMGIMVAPSSRPSTRPTTAPATRPTTAPAGNGPVLMGAICPPPGPVSGKRPATLPAASVTVEESK
ncbi:MAG TPA: hypothetical protein VF796_03440 [Humisphaera sp.]